MKEKKMNDEQIEKHVDFNERLAYYAANVAASKRRDKPDAIAELVSFCYETGYKHAVKHCRERMSVSKDGDRAHWQCNPGKRWD